jgi:hypothetical protein
MNAHRRRLLSERVALVRGNTISLSGAHLRSSVATRCVATVQLIENGGAALIVTGKLEEQIRTGELAYVGGNASDTIRQVGKSYRLGINGSSLH